MTLGIFIPFFWFNNNTSPLGKTLEIPFVYTDGDPIPGLTVNLYAGETSDATEGTPLQTVDTDSEGKAIFSGLIDQRYWWNYYWQTSLATGEIAEWRGYIDITCDKIVWEAPEQRKSKWDIKKTIKYDDGTPVWGLPVYLDGECLALTNAEGAAWIGSLTPGTYTLSYKWQGTEYYSEAITIVFTTEEVIEIENTVPYWTLKKTFTYADDTPIVGLNIALDGETDITDETGTVSFSGLKSGMIELNVWYSYTISWSWQGVGDSKVITLGFQDPTPYPLTNKLAYWTVEKTFTYEDGTAIVDLDVTLSPTMVSDVQYGKTDADGKVTFTGVKAGYYVLSCNWQGPQTHDFTIGFQDELLVTIPINVLPYWTVEKTFVYDITDYPAKEGLAVTLRYPDGTTVVDTTDSTGLVTFADLKAGEYTLEWVWGGDKKTEPVSIGFSDETPWTKTNNLAPKSGGG